MGKAQEEGRALLFVKSEDVPGCGIKVFLKKHMPPFPVEHGYVTLGQNYNKCFFPDCNSWRITGFPCCHAMRAWETTSFVSLCSLVPQELTVKSSLLFYTLAAMKSVLVPPFVYGDHVSGDLRTVCKPKFSGIRQRGRPQTKRMTRNSVRRSNARRKQGIMTKVMIWLSEKPKKTGFEKDTIKLMQRHLDQVVAILKQKSISVKKRSVYQQMLLTPCGEPLQKRLFLHKAEYLRMKKGKEAGTAIEAALSKLSNWSYESHGYRRPELVTVLVPRIQEHEEMDTISEPCTFENVVKALTTKKPVSFSRRMTRGTRRKTPRKLRARTDIINEEKKATGDQDDESAFVWGIIDRECFIKYLF